MNYGIYTALMAQSRNPDFYGESRFADDYDGRIDVLTLHIAAVLSNLNRFGQNGQRLGQALFDEMKDDFEVALREEALSDASVKKRIQPMISLFYDRVKTSFQNNLSGLTLGEIAMTSFEFPACPA